MGLGGFPLKASANLRTIFGIRKFFLFFEQIFLFFPHFFGKISGNGTYFLAKEAILATLAIIIIAAMLFANLRGICYLCVKFFFE